MIRPFICTSQTPIKRHIKVWGHKSSFEGDWPFWVKRRRQQPGLPKRIAILLKRQVGQCAFCGLYFGPEDTLEVDHLLPNSQDDKDEYNNWQLLHAHCHPYKTGREQQQMIIMLCGYNSQSCEEPDEGSLSSLVLNQR